MELFQYSAKLLAQTLARWRRLCTWWNLGSRIHW